MNFPRLRDQRDITQHRPEMAGASHQDEEVPQLVEPEHSRPDIGPPEAVDHGSYTVDEAAAEDPGHPARRYGLQDGRDGHHGDPAHGQVEAHGEPPGCVHPQELEHDAAEGERPYDAEQPYAPATLQCQHADG